MAYFPKSSVIFGDAKSGEFIYLKNGKNYSGPYMVTSDNRYYAGNNSINPGPQLLKSTPATKDFGQTLHVKKYNLLKNNIYTTNRKHLNIQPSKTIPNEKDYKKGYFSRYYLVKSNDATACYEINKKSYEEIVLKKRHDHRLYMTGVLRWSLKGDVIKSNSQTLLRIRTQKPKLKNLVTIFNKLDEWYRIPEVPEGTSVEHDIKNRYYPDENGEPGELIPSNLPPAYNLPPNPNKKCLNCVYYLEGVAGVREPYCNRWQANIRQGYWCKSWQVNIKNYIELTYEDFLETQPPIEEHVVGAWAGPAGPHPPFGIVGERDGARRRHPTGVPRSKQSTYKWVQDIDSWVLIKGPPFSLFTGGGNYPPFNSPGTAIGVLRRHNSGDFYEWDGIQWVNSSTSRA